MVVVEQTRRNRARLSQSARPQSARPQSARPQSARPQESPELPAPPSVSAGISAGVRHPISRWYLIPLARVVAAGLAFSPLTRSRIRPSHVTLAGFGFAATAAGVLFWRPDAGAIAAVFVLAAWFCDRIDGMLARLQVAASAWGGWLDANVDELVDVAMQTAVAAAAARLSGSQWPGLLLVAFLAGKYLFMFGLSSEEKNGPSQTPDASQSVVANRDGWLRRLYHLPADADVRVHFLVVALFFGWFTAELAVVAVYYNLRWMVRYPLVARRLGGWRLGGWR